MGSPGPRTRRSRSMSFVAAAGSVFWNSNAPISAAGSRGYVGGPNNFGLRRQDRNEHRRQRPHRSTYWLGR